MSKTETKTHVESVLDSKPVAVRHLRFRKGDILQIALGGDMGDGQPPWIPTEDDMEYARVYWNSFAPPYVKVVVTHYMEVPTVLSDDEYTDE